MKTILLIVALAICEARPKHGHHDNGHHKGHHDGTDNSLTVDTFIIGGQDATPNMWPEIVSLIWNGNSQFCGGALLNAFTVITAAHCVHGNDDPSDYSSYTVRMGSYDKTLTLNEKGISNIVKHEHYNHALLTNDIALIELNSAADLSESHISSIALVDPVEDIYTGYSLHAAGWGLTKANNADSAVDDLKEVEVYRISDDECWEDYPDWFVDEIMLCASSPRKDTCQGDSGGPLKANIGETDPPTWRLVGLSSWGIGCGDNKYPGVYTKVSEYVDWIHSHTFNN